MSAVSRADEVLVVRSADGRANLHVSVSGDGPALLLVHGWALDHRIFAPQVPELSRAFTVVAHDRRGFGRSTGAPDLDADLDDLEQLIDHLSLGKVHLLGMSQGGRIALRFALLRPQRLRSLLLQAPAVDGFVASCTDEVIPVADYAALVRAGRIGDMRAAWAAHPMMAAGVRDAATRRFLAAILADYRGTDLLGPGESIRQPPVNVAAQLDAIDMPTLILTGLLETAARREHATFLRTRLPRAREVLFRDSGHLSNVTEPDAYNRAVLDFCRASGQGVSGRSAEN